VVLGRLSSCLHNNADVTHEGMGIENHADAHGESNLEVQEQTLVVIVV